MENTVRALAQNASSDRSRIVMEAGTFVTAQEAISKFINISNQSPSPNVLQIRHERPANYNNIRNNTYRQNAYRPAPNNFNRGRSNNYRGNRGGNFSQYGRGSNGRNRNNFNNRPSFIRYLEENVEESGNQQGPRQAQLGTLSE